MKILWVCKNTGEIRKTAANCTPKKDETLQEFYLHDWIPTQVLETKT